MLQNLHVKNLALIEEAEVDFNKGLNIMTGETGAGKSIVVGSINLALGEKVSKDMIRKEEEAALVELLFTIDNENQLSKLKDMDIYPEDNQIILSRKITGQRSIAKVNGETVTVSTLKEIAALFIDIYGQQESQTLLDKKKHLAILDSFGNEDFQNKLAKMSKLYNDYRRLEKELLEANKRDDNRDRELDLLKHEIAEIEAANLRENEDTDLEESYRIMSGSKKVAENAANAFAYLSGGDEAAGDLVGRALREFSDTSDFDDTAKNIYQEMMTLDDLLSSLSHDLRKYIEELSFSPEEFYQVEERLNIINRLKDKYGNSIEEINLSLKERYDRVNQLTDYDAYLEKLNTDFNRVKKECYDLGMEIREMRKKLSSELTFKVTQALIDLNFLDVKFDMDFTELTEPSKLGFDQPEFIISVNPGEPLKPLRSVASGGELSRIMLALKSVIAVRDQIPTLIFDEIDTGISGRTAQMVSEKMNEIGRNTQVISITHLPQIAAMADTHFLIEKSVQGQVTISDIHVLNEDEEIEELSRMLGGVAITDTVRENAREMKRLAKAQK